MTHRHHWPAAIALGLLVAGCGSAPPDAYVAGAGLDPRDKQLAEEQPNAAAAAALLRVARATRAAGDYTSAINVLKRAHKLAPGDGEIAVELGESLAAVGAYDEAREVMTAAARLRADDTRALRGLANALVALSEPALAAGRYRQALAVRKEAATYNGLGVALDILNDVEGAAAAYRSGLAIEPRNPSLVGNLALSLALRGESTRAIELIAAQLREGRSTPRLRQNLALIYGLANRMDDARVLLRVDLDERAVVNNIAYYEMLRGLKAEPRRDAVLGRRTIVAPSASVAANPPGNPVNRPEPDTTPKQMPEAAPTPAPRAPVSPAEDRAE